jgi:hypothetical protein
MTDAYFSKNILGIAILASAEFAPQSFLKHVVKSYHFGLIKMRPNEKKSLTMTLFFVFFMFQSERWVVVKTNIPVL